jgi:hypothetical protein
MLRLFKVDNNLDILRIAIIIAIILGLSTSVIFMVIEKGSYSAIYIIPDSIIHNSDDNTVLYKFGVKSSESGNMDYSLDTYLNDILIKTRQFSLNKGEILDEQDKITLPADTQYPAKISLRLTTNTATEEVHFWLRKNLLN